MMAEDRPTRIDWSTDEPYWREHFRSRPYADQTRGFDYYRPGYKYSYDAANRLGRRSWDEAEPELRRGWESYEGRGESKWEQVKDSVRDAWDRITGSDTRRER
jgi:hypothetical protein